MDRALNYMALARKAGRIELGEEPVGAAARAVKACLVMVASDAGDHTWRRAKSFVAGTSQIAVKLPFCCAKGRAAGTARDISLRKIRKCSIFGGGSKLPPYGCGIKLLMLQSSRGNS